MALKRCCHFHLKSTSVPAFHSHVFLTSFYLSSLPRRGLFSQNWLINTIRQPFRCVMPQHVWLGCKLRRFSRGATSERKGLVFPKVYLLPMPQSLGKLTLAVTSRAHFVSLLSTPEMRSVGLGPHEPATDYFGQARTRLILLRSSFSVVVCKSVRHAQHHETNALREKRETDCAAISTVPRSELWGLQSRGNVRECGALIRPRFTT